MPTQAPDPTARSVNDLTRAVFGRGLSMNEAFAALSEGSLDPGEESTAATPWIGSIGYERFSSNADFARALADAEVELLIDVRDLPISRKRGFAKTALGEALDEIGIGYRHWKKLGNPKEIRDLYKSGQVEDGRKRYERHLAENEDELDELEELITSGKRVALMCVEHDEDICHRQSILQALKERREGGLLVAQVRQS